MRVRKAVRSGDRAQLHVTRTRATSTRTSVRSCYRGSWTEPYIDELVYTSDLPHSKPHPTVFREIATPLGVPSEACVRGGLRPGAS